MNEQEVKKLYQALLSKGYSTQDLGDEQRFLSKMGDANNRKQLYDWVSSRGNFRIGDFDAYEARLTSAPAGVAAEEVNTPAQPTPAASVAEPTTAAKPTKEDKPQVAVAEASTAAKPTKEDLAQAQAQTEQILRKSQGTLRDASNRLKFLEGTRGLQVAPMRIGESRRVVEGEKHLNPETGEIESQYITESGNEYERRELADLEENTRVQARSAQYWSSDEGMQRASREQVATLGEDIRESLNRRGQELDAEAMRSNLGDRPMGGGALVHTFNSSTVNGRYADREWRALNAANNAMVDAKRVIDAADANSKNGTFAEWLNQSFMGGAQRGFGEKLFDARTWDMGLSEGVDAEALADALHAADSGEELTDAQRMLLDAKAVELATNAYFGSYVGKGYKAGQVTGESIPFMIEMCLNPASKTGETLQSALSRYAIKRFAKKAAGEAAEKLTEFGLRRAVIGAGKGGMVRAAGIVGRGVGDLAGASAMAGTSGIVGTTADAISRTNGDVRFTPSNGHVLFDGHEDGDDFSTAFRKAFAGRAIENYSEMFGEYFSPLLGVVGKGASKVMDKLGLGVVNDFMKNVAASDVARLISDFEKNAKWNGVFGEYAEEVAGGIMNALVVEDQTLDTNPDTGVFNLDNNIDTFLGVSLMGGFMSAMKTVGYRTPKYRARKDMSAKDDAAASAFGNQETWGGIRNTIAFGEDADVKDKLKEVLTNPDYSSEQRAAVLEYAKAVETYRGMLRGEEKRRADRETDPTQTDLETSFDNGYSLSGFQEMNDARNMYEYQRRRIGDFATDDMLAQLEADPVGALNAIRMSGSWTDEEKQAAIDFVNAKATYDGMIAHVQDDIESRVNASDAMIAGRQHKGDGLIHPATMKMDDRKVYVVGGNIVMSDDGTMVDREKSDESIVIRDANTGNLEFADPRDVLSVDEAIDAEQEKQAARDVIRQEYAQAAADKIDGVLPFNEGDSYQVMDEQGQPHTVTVVAPAEGPGVNGANGQNVTAGDGEVLVSFDGGEAVPISKEVIQTMADNANLARLQQFEQEKAQRRAQEAEAQREASRPLYNINDVVTLQTDEGTVRGSITAEANEDGLIEVYTEQPIGGKKINLFTRDELDGMVVEHNGNVAPQVQPTENESAVLPQGTTENGAGLDNAGGEAGVANGTGANNPPATAPSTPAADATGTVVEPMPMIGEGEDAEPDFLGVAPARAHTYIYKEAGLSREEADQFIEANKKTADKELKKAQEKAPKIGTSLAKYKKEQTEWQAKVDAAQQKADYWQAVKDEQKKVLDAEAHASGLDLFDAAERNSAEMQRAMDELAGDREAMAILADREPHTLEEIAASMLAGGVKVLSKDEEVDGTLRKGLLSHTGYSRADVQRMPFIFASAKKGGLSVDAFGEGVLQRARDLGVRYDVDDAMAGVNALLNVMGEVRRQGDLNNYIQNRRIAEARAYHEEMLRQEDETIAEWAESYHLSVDEVEAFMEYLSLPPTFSFTEDEIQEIYSIFADEILTEEDNGEQNQGSAGLDRRPVETGVPGEGEGSQGEVLGDGLAGLGGQDDAGRGDSFGASGGEGSPNVSGDALAGGTRGEVGAEVVAAEQETNVNPTPAQRDVGIENSKGSTQRERINQQEIGGAMIDRLEEMGMEVSIDPAQNRRVQKRAENDKSEEGKIRHFTTTDGKTYGFAYKGKIYLDPRKINAELPIHEYAHLWCEAFRRLNPEGWKDIVTTTKADAETWQFIKQLNPDLTSDDDIAEEMIAKFSGKKGAERARAEFERMNGKDRNYKSKWGNIWSNISKAINDFWKKIGDFLNIKYESAEQVYDQVVKDFADKVNPRKRVEDWLKERDAAYMAAVNDGDMAKAKELFDVALRENIGNGITPFLSVRGYSDVRKLAHGVKSRDPKIIAEVADMMAPLIPKDAVLVPAPGHSGDATDMLDLARALSERTGAPVADVLKGNERVSQYEAKQAGGVIAAGDMGITMQGELPEGLTPIVIDNVVDTGNTAEACVKALGRGIVVSLGDSADRYRHVASLKSAEPVVTDKKGNVVPLSRRFEITSKYLDKASDNLSFMKGDVQLEGDAQERWEKTAAILNEMEEKYFGREMDAVWKGMSDEELFRALGVPEEEIAKSSPEEIKSFREWFFSGNSLASYNQLTGNIIIFAENLAPERAEEAFFHENIHAILHKWYGNKALGIAERFWDAAPDEGGKVDKAFIKRNYPEEKWPEEFFVNWLGKAMADGSVDEVYGYLTEEPMDAERLDNILNTIDYGREQEARKEESPDRLVREKYRDRVHGSGRNSEVGYDREQETRGQEAKESSDGQDPLGGFFAEAERIANKVAVQQAIKAAEREVNTAPSEGQKKAGNYKMGHVKIDGFDVTVENPKGSVRRGTAPNGKQWEQEMHNTYGYILGTEGVDGDHIDVFLSDDPTEGDVFVIDQVNKDGSFDEHKVMYGFPDIESARKAYLSNYEEGWQGLGAITEVSKDEFKKWVNSSHRKTKPFAEYKSVKPLGDVMSVMDALVGEESVAGHVEVYKSKDGKVVAYQSLLFGDEDAGVNMFPEDTEKVEAQKSVEAMSDEELLQAIADNEERDKGFHIDEYDKRHQQEWDDAVLSYAQMLEKDVIDGKEYDEILENAYGMYGDVSRRWRDGGYATPERTTLRAQMDALEAFIEHIENEKYDMVLDEEREQELQAASKEHEQQAEAAHEVGFNPAGIRLRPLKKGETCYVERRYEENKMFSFTGKERVKSADDVAYIFKQLETASVENTFIVLIKDGRPTIIHLGMGNYNTAPAPIEQALVAFRELQPDKVVFVHNHPSGVVKASREDKALLHHVEMAFGTDKVAPGIIIDTTSGKYGEFTSMNDEWEGERPTTHEDAVPMKVYNFSQQVFAEGWNPMEAFQAVSSSGIAKFISSHRLGKHKKMSLLVLNTQNRIVGNIFLPWTDMKEMFNKDAKGKDLANGVARLDEAARMMSGYINQMGGVRGVLYGNYGYDTDILKLLQGSMNHLNTPLMDVLHIMDDGDYESARESGAMEPASVESAWAGASDIHSENFKKWFGDWEKDPEHASKVVDNNGKPLVVYHGTTNGKFNVFDKKRIGERWNVDEVGFFFTDKKSIGEDYTRPYFPDEKAEPYLFEVYLNIKNPLNINSRWFREKYGRNISRYDAIEIWDDNQSDILDEFNKGDYDGIIINPTGMGMPQPEMYVTFEPNQIKSATDNNGEYDANNPDIRFRDDESEAGVDSEVLFGKAKELFGTTRDIREAGYILPDGTMLDFSGRHLLNPGQDSSFLRGDRTTDHREVASLAYEKDGNTPTGIETDMPDFIRRGAIRIDAKSGNINLSTKPTPKQRTALRQLISMNDGYVQVDFGDGWDSDHYAEYDRAKPTRVLGDIDRYFDEGVKPEGNAGVLYRDDSSEIFVSNARRAVEGIKQEKATPEQWLKMIEKAGGLKAGEDKWMGLSDWLKGIGRDNDAAKKTLTKEEVLDFIRENQIEVQEVEYGEMSSAAIDQNPKMQELTKEFNELFDDSLKKKDEVSSEMDSFDNEMLEKYGEGWHSRLSTLSDEDRKRNADLESRYEAYSSPAEYAFHEMVEHYGDDFSLAFEVRNGVLQPIYDYYSESPTEYALNFLDMGNTPINSTRLSYTTEGLENKREIALVVPTIEPWNESDEVHFGDAGGGRAVAWVRFGETTDADGKRVLVIDEIQSKRHQEGREKGYKSDAIAKMKPQADEMRKRHEELVAKRDELIDRDMKRREAIRLSPEGQALIGEDGYIKEGKVEEYRALFDNDKELDAIAEEKSPITREILEMEQEMLRMNDVSLGLVPDAPFEKNWHELAMKRMLRYAAENGFDKVAWTTGAQQAERYDLGGSVKNIQSYINDDGTRHVMMNFENGGFLTCNIDSNGTIVSTSGHTQGIISEGMSLNDVVGKELGQKIVRGEGEVVQNRFVTDREVRELGGNNLRIGGEGMNGFYDEMLPRFMNKYGKKWGVKVGEVELPNIGDQTYRLNSKGKMQRGLTMWAVDVTPEMVDSVMQGQVMFRTSKELFEQYPTWLSGQTTETGQHTTQITSTEKTYKRIGEWMKNQGMDEAKVLDASSGLGAGTRALRDMGFDVDDVEPYPSGKREKPTYSRYEDVDGQYDVVISNAVLNVIPDDWRADVLKQMADKVKPNGKIIVNVRDAKSIEGQKQKIVLDNPSEILVTDSKGAIRAYQKGFTKQELKGWVESELGEGWTVEIANEGNSGIKSGTAVVVTRGEKAQSPSYREIKTREGEAGNRATHEESLAISRRAGYTKKQHEAWAARTARRMRGEVERVVELLGLGDRVSILDDGSGLRGRKARAKGWFDVKTGKIVIVLGNHGSVGDVVKTILHEGVAHYGLRKMFGQRFDQFLDNVFQYADEDVRARIVDLAKKHNWDFREATEEYLARLAEDMDFERAHASGWWSNIKTFFLKMMHDLGLSSYSGSISDNELRYILWRSYENLKEPGAYRNLFADAEDISKQMELKVGRFEDGGAGLSDNYGYAGAAVAEGESAADDVQGGERFRDDEDDSSDESDGGDEMPSVDAGEETLEEVIIRSTARLAREHKDSLQMRINAMHSIGGNLSKLRKAMSYQRSYDRETVNAIVRQAKMLMDTLGIDKMTRGEVKKLLGLINGSAGKDDIMSSANSVLDLMIQHQLRSLADILHKQMSIRGSKLNGSGVEVQGRLDADGKRMLDAMNDGMSISADAIDERISDCLDKMGGTDEVAAKEASVEYQGYLLAKQWHDDIKSSEEEESDLLHELKESRGSVKAGTMDRSSYREFVSATEDAIRENRLQRMDSYYRLLSNLGDGLASSIARAKAFREREVERVREIQHNANSDLQGVACDEHSRPTWTQKAANWSFVRFYMKPLATFNKMLHLFGRRSVNGEGYLWNRFMGGYTLASDREWRNLRAAHKVLDQKVSEVFGRKMKWSDLFAVERKLPGMTAEFWDGGERKSHELSQGNLLYIYMVNKMSDGKMKLRKMGISEEDVDAIKLHLDPRFVELADWLQDHFLKDKRREYNEVHERLFGVSMAAIENYFPLVINSRSRGKEEEIGEPDNGDAKPATITGSIIKRKKNSLALDVTGADAFDVVLGHLQQMEHWAAFAELNRDMNTLLSYKKFRNRVLNMSTLEFGGGETLWKNFKDVCSIAAGVYHPQVSKNSLDTAVVNVAKGVTQAKIAFRIFTALKQLLSYPAYLSEANIIELAKTTNPLGAWKAWNWAMKELPGFSKRWQSRQSGDNRLKESDVDWRFWKNRFVETLGRLGMTPNAFIDGLTVAMGSKAIYNTKLKQFLRDGYSKEKAKEKALLAAAVSYNETQQSSENAYLSAMQLDRTVASVALTVFRNASMGYQRRLMGALRNLKRKLTPGYMDESIAFMSKQMVRDGLSEEQAARAAKRAYYRSWYGDVADVALFGFVMQLAWNLGPYIPYLLMGDDDDEKDAMLEDAVLHATAGSVEGLSGGNVMSELYNMSRKGESLSNYNMSLLPALSDIQTMLRHYKSDKVAAASDFVNLLVQSGIGVNPQTITDAYVAIMDYSGGDESTSREFALLLMRLSQVPQSQIDKFYIDELGLHGSELQGKDVTELAERYARYKRLRGAGLLGWAYSDEEEMQAENRYLRRFNELRKERMKSGGDPEVKAIIDAYKDGEYKEQKALRENLRLRYGSDLDAYESVMSDLANSPEEERRKAYDSYVRKRSNLLKAGKYDELGELESDLAKLLSGQTSEDSAGE